MNITATAVAVTLALVVSVAFLFYGPNIFRPFASTTTVNEAPLASTTDVTLNQNTMQGPSDTQGQNQTPQGAPQALPTTLTVSDILIGTGAEAKDGDVLTMNYVGAFPDGKVFDSSANHGPFTFTLGTHQVISGWDKGLVGMKVGGKRQLIIPPDMAYGPQGQGPIPGNATLIFQVELIKIGK